MKIYNIYMILLILFMSKSDLYSKLQIISSMNPITANLGYNDPNPNTNGELEVIHEFIKFENVVFDVGANIGEWSNPVYSLNINLSLYTFEPVIETYKILTKNLNLINISHNNIALSDTIGSEKIRYYPQASALSCLHYRPILEETFKLNPVILTISTNTLDNFCLKNKIEKINFLKIDTEGHEYKILLGSIENLKNSKIDFIQFEYGGTYKDANITLEQVYNFLNNLGYSIFRIFNEGLISIESWQNNLENYNYSNYLAISNKSSFVLNSN